MNLYTNSKARIYKISSDNKKKVGGRIKLFTALAGSETEAKNIT